FPAGFLQPPNYNPSDSESRKLGLLGCVIGHEISHAFDANGANVDANGAMRYWWTQADRAEYDARCAKVSAFFDGRPIESAFGHPLWFGLKNTGALTLNENMADLNGVHCALEVLKGLDDPDYRAFFQAYAEYNRQIETRKMRALLAGGDPHSLPVIRVNRTLSNFSEFQETYGIVKGDPMYVAPEDRVSVW
ncbi:MAG TPA: M13-type metalloendopeptidase, partial [Treponemataceae bacterium]|nr:M13-type metalloendopeptidase [Treponemataceae bacterium]